MKQALVPLVGAGLLVSGALAATQLGPDAPSASSPGRAQAPPELMALLSESREREVAVRLQAIAAEREQLDQQVEVQGRAYVRMLRLGLLPLSSGFDGLVQHAGRITGLARAIQRRLDLVRSLDGQAAALKDGVAEAQRQRTELKAQLSDFQRSHDAILAAREREAAYQRAFGGAGGGLAVYSAIRSGQEDVDTFVELKGKLPLPVEGRAEVEEVEATTTHGPAVQLSVEIGAVARSVFKGRVVLIGDHEGGGRAVVVDHGGGYSSVTGNLKRVHVHTGDEVSRGAVLGETTTEDGHGVVYFEVRKDGTNLFPADWFGL